jgi:hypothetical protein
MSINQLTDLFLGLENLLDNLLFFDQESTDNTVTDTVSTTRSTISTANVLLGLGDSSKLTRTESLDLFIIINKTTSIYVHCILKLTPARASPQSPQRGALTGFFSYWTTSFPPIHILSIFPNV